MILSNISTVVDSSCAGHQINIEWKLSINRLWPSPSLLFTSLFTTAYVAISMYCSLPVLSHTQWNPHLMFLNIRFPLIQLQLKRFQINNLAVKLPPYKIFLSLVFKSTDGQRNPNEFHCIHPHCNYGQSYHMTHTGAGAHPRTRAHTHTKLQPGEKDFIHLGPIPTSVNEFATSVGSPPPQPTTIMQENIFYLFHSLCH
jgi:hypothetical protein